jgi:hypothetical protein
VGEVVGRASAMRRGGDVPAARGCTLPARFCGATIAAPLWPATASSTLDVFGVKNVGRCVGDRFAESGRTASNAGLSAEPRTAGRSFTFAACGMGLPLGRAGNVALSGTTGAPSFPGLSRPALTWGDLGSEGGDATRGRGFQGDASADRVSGRPDGAGLKLGAVD